MDLLQLVFGFVNAPLFATFLLGMFWRRTTGHGALSSGLLSGTSGRRAHTWPDAGGRQRRVDRACSHIPFHNGPEFLDRDLRLDDMLPGDDPGQSRYAARSRTQNL